MSATRRMLWSLLAGAFLCAWGLWALFAPQHGCGIPITELASDRVGREVVRGSTGYYYCGHIARSAVPFGVAAVAAGGVFLRQAFGRGWRIPRDPATSAPVA